MCFLQTRSLLLHKILIDGLESCGLLVHYFDVFVDAKFLQNCYEEETSSSTSWPEVEYIFSYFILF